MYEIKLSMLQGNGCFYFLWVCSEESTTVLFSPPVTNADSEILSYLVQVQCFQLTFE